MARLTGLTGLAGYQVQIDNESQATPEQRSGDPANPKHGIPGEQARPYPWESRAGGSHGPYGPENQLLGDDEWFWESAGDPTDDPYRDHTPLHHAAPWPKGIASGPVPSEGPDDIALQLRQSLAIHSIYSGASRRSIYSPQGDVQNDVWVELDELNPGHSDLQDNGRQAKSSGFMWGTRDRIQSFARQNEFGFDSAHMHRRYAAGSIPGNFMWMRPGGRPMMKTLPGPARPAIGPGSPFEGDDLGAAFGIDGAVLQTVPSEYRPPPQPNLAPAVISDTNDAVVEWY